MIRSGNDIHTKEKSNKTKGILLVLFFMTYLIYLFWRFRYTIPIEYGLVSLIAGSILFLAEVVGFFESVIFYFTLWDTKVIPPKEAEEEKYPHIDVFVATYNEPEELLYKTILGCKNMSYPDKSKVHIYICDDGDRASMRKLCEKMNVSYIRRDTHEHAKAGNLNHALAVTTSPLVVTFDADMIPMHDFLLVTVPYFIQEENVGYVQVPQNFYNADLFQYNLFTESNMPNEQDLFSRLIQAGKAKHNAVIYAGSNTVLSRAALDEIGGLVTGTITEDFATGMKIQSRGYKCRYVNEVHASGLAPETAEDLYNQRIRWGRGVIQTFKSFNPFFMKGLNIKQRLLYLSTFSYWYFGLWRLIFFTAPILFAVFGIIVLDARAFTMLAIWLPMFVFTNVTFRYFTNNVRSVSWSHIYDTILFPQILTGVLKETFGIKMSKFKVTPKEKVTQDSYIQRFGLVRFQMILAGLTCFGLIRIGYLFVTTGFQVQFAINIFWLAYNMYIFVMAIFFASERPKFRKNERISAKEAVLVKNGRDWYEGYSIDLSESGVTLVLPEALYFSESGSYEIRIETKRYIAEMKGKVIRVDTFQGKFKYIFEIKEISPESKDEYLMILYDRVPVFPYQQKGGHLFTNIHSNIRNRRKKILPLSRKLPRVRIDKEVDIDIYGVPSKLLAEDFNYEYLTSKTKVYAYSFDWKPDGLQGEPLECILDEKLTEKVDRGLYFYKVLNYQESMGHVSNQH